MIEAVSGYYRTSNANHGGAFLTSQRSDAILEDAHAALADLLNAADPDEIKLGANMTTLTMHVARSIAARHSSPATSSPSRASTTRPTSGRGAPSPRTAGSRSAPSTSAPTT